MSYTNTCQYCYPPSHLPILPSNNYIYENVEEQYLSDWTFQYPAPETDNNFPETWLTPHFYYQPLQLLHIEMEEQHMDAVAAPASQETMAQLQKLSQEYQPEVTGPLVGKLLPSQVLAQEYASADPIFIKKTAALQPKYSHYRTIRGDGNCGWRALAFGYLELVQRAGDPEFAQQELARLISLNNVMNEAGFAEYLYEDFVEETLDALKAIGVMTSPETRYHDSLLLEIFNTQEKSDAIITHIKLLTSAYMKTMPDAYEAFIETSMNQYCETNVEPYGVEIDHIGVNGLIDCLILPAGFAVEIFYLDRSSGEEVNIHRFEKIVDGKVVTPADAPVMRILYRPGHYDLLYKNGDIPVSSGSSIPAQNIHVNMVHSEQYYNPPFTSSIFGLESQPFPSSSAMSAFKQEFMPDIPKTIPYPVTPFNNMYDMPSNFRPSAFQLKAAQEEIPFQTKTFKNSHFNKSHFLNDQFQPEMYNPDQSGDDSDEMMS